VPRYYFHVRDGRATVLDHVGLNLADNHEASKEAARRGRKIAKTNVGGNATKRLAIVVADAQGFPIFEVPVVGR
jgi:uncharacterized protein YjcR